MEVLYKYINIDSFSATPKYLQIANSVIRAVKNGYLIDGDPLPSIEELSMELDVSLDIIEYGYERLKKLGILTSIIGKGHFFKNSQANEYFEVFLLFNKLSTHKKFIYDSFANALGANAIIDFYIYNNDFNLFQQLIKKSIGNYAYYVIIPHLREDVKNIDQILALIPSKQLILLDKRLQSPRFNCSSVFENFEQDIYLALEKMLSRLQKYHTIKVVFPSNTYLPKEILKGLNDFCIDYTFDYFVVDDVRKEVIYDGIVYITLLEENLISLVEKIIEADKKVGKDVGIISYNETPLKKVILNGITTVSTDFEYMGASAANLILKKESGDMAAPFRLTLRNSL